MHINSRCPCLFFRSCATLPPRGARLHKMFKTMVKSRSDDDADLPQSSSLTRPVFVLSWEAGFDYIFQHIDLQSGKKATRNGGAMAIEPPVTRRVRISSDAASSSSSSSSKTSRVKDEQNGGPSTPKMKKSISLIGQKRGRDQVDDSPASKIVPPRRTKSVGDVNRLSDTERRGLVDDGYKRGMIKGFVRNALEEVTQVRLAFPVLLA